MSITLELAPDTEARLRRRAQQHGQDIGTYLLGLVEKDAQRETVTVDLSEGTAADLFAGRLGRIKGSTEAYSQNCGERFTEYLLEKKRNGHL